MKGMKEEFPRSMILMDPHPKLNRWRGFHSINQLSASPTSPSLLYFRPPSNLSLKGGSSDFIHRKIATDLENRNPKRVCVEVAHGISPWPILYSAMSSSTPHSLSLVSASWSSTGPQGRWGSVAPPFFVFLNLPRSYSVLGFLLSLILSSNSFIFGSYLFIISFSCVMIHRFQQSKLW